MNDRCSNFWEGIIQLAEGGTSEAARRHLESCATCAEKLEQLQFTFAAAKLSYSDAPIEVIEAAKNLMPQPRRIFAPLLSSTTMWSGARTAAEDFQLVVGSLKEPIRLMYSRSEDGWDVMGRVPSPEWRVVALGEPTPVDEAGRFAFRAASLAETGFEANGPEQAWTVPSAEELLSGGSAGRS